MEYTDKQYCYDTSNMINANAMYLQINTGQYEKSMLYSVCEKNLRTSDIGESNQF
ncbi:hypothetical protein SAMN05660816_02501 [Niastella yeongjuensis]|nr:hypothetical protein SAMN05660816_02501 [Niastella yeongjuensis]